MVFGDVQPRLDGDVLCGGGRGKEKRRGRIGEVKKVKDSQRQLGLCGCPMECGDWRVLVGDIEIASMRRRQIGDFLDARTSPFDGWRLRQSEPTRLNGAAMPGPGCAANCTRKYEPGLSNHLPPALLRQNAGHRVA
jgi:hypothetical protein